MVNDSKEFFPPKQKILDETLPISWLNMFRFASYCPDRGWVEGLGVNGWELRGCGGEGVWGWSDIAGPWHHGYRKATQPLPLTSSTPYFHPLHLHPFHTHKTHHPHPYILLSHSLSFVLNCMLNNLNISLV